MRTPPYTFPLQEFWFTASLAAGGAGTFNVFELVPPRGTRLVVTSIIGVNQTTSSFRCLVSSGTAITAAGADASCLVSNPPGILVFARTGRRADVGILGFVYFPSFTMPWTDRHVVDSVADQRFIMIAQTVNESSSVSVKGILTAAELDTADRLDV